MKSTFSWKYALAIAILGLGMILSFQNCSSRFKNNITATPDGSVKVTNGDTSSSLSGPSVDYFSMNHLGPTIVRPGETINIRYNTSNATVVKGLISATGSCAYKTQQNLDQTQPWQIPQYTTNSSTSFTVPNDNSFVGCTFNYCITAFDDSNSSAPAQTAVSQSTKCASFGVSNSGSATSPRVNSFTMLNNAGSQNITPGQTVNINFQASNATFLKGVTKVTGTCSYKDTANFSNWPNWTYDPLSTNPVPGSLQVSGTNLSHSGTWTAPHNGVFDGCTYEYCITAFNASSTSFVAKNAPALDTMCASFTIPQGPRISYFEMNPNPVPQGGDVVIRWATTNTSLTKGRMKHNGSCGWKTFYNGSSGWADWLNAYIGQPTTEHTWQSPAVSDTARSLVGCTFDYCITAVSSPSETAKEVDSFNSKCVMGWSASAAPPPPVISNRCQINLTDCPAYPSHQLGTFDDLAVPAAVSDTTGTTCLQRAGDFYGWCQTVHPVTATYFSGSTAVATATYPNFTGLSAGQCYLLRYPDICQNSPYNYCYHPDQHYIYHGASEGRIWGCAP